MKLETLQNMPISRRHLLSRSLAASTILSLGNTRLLAASGQLQWQDLEPGLALVSGAGGNVLVFSGNEGVALVDGGHAASAQALLKLVEDRTGKRPALLFNTHCHRDQVGSNALLGEAGATIIAHENTRLWLGTEIISLWEDTVYPPLADSALPNQTFWYDSEQLDFNGESVEYGYLFQGHTDGDIYVRFPQRNLIMAGGVVATSAYPVLDYSTNGWIGGMIDSLRLLIELCDDETRIVASDGQIVNKAHLQAQLEMGSSVAGVLGEHLYKGGSFEELLALRPTAQFDERWGDPALFLHQLHTGTLPHITEIRRYGPPRR